MGCACLSNSLRAAPRVLHVSKDAATRSGHTQASSGTSRGAWSTGGGRKPQTPARRELSREELGMGCTSGHPWRTEHTPPTRGAVHPELPRAASPPPAWSQPAAAKETVHKGKETGAQNPKGAWPPGRLSTRPARWAHLLSCVLADTDHSPADRGAGSPKISGAAVTTEESRGPSAVTPFTGGHLGFGARQRRPGSQRQQRSTDGSLGVRDERPGLPVTGVRPHGGKALTVSGTTASCARGAGRRGAPGVPSTHTPGTLPALSRREATLSDTSAPQPGSGVC